MNIIILSKNYKNYKSGNYHQDIINSLSILHNCFLYGLGYDNYKLNDTIFDVIEKSKSTINSVDLIITSTSWDEDTSKDNVDPHPNICLSKVDFVKKVYFLNKEYKKLDLRFEYAKKNKFNFIVTVHPKYKDWESVVGIKFIYLPFGISLERFNHLNLDRKYDFGFSGGLHKSHTDLRYLVKKQIFKSSSIDQKSNFGLSSFLKPNPFKSEYSKYKIFWAEWGAKNYNYRSLLPSGDKYKFLLNNCKVFLNTPSAIGIFNTRFFELMATKTLIFCPKSELYNNILKDQYNCLMFNPDMSDFDYLFNQAVNNSKLRDSITINAINDVSSHSYDNRIKSLIKIIKNA